MAPGAVVAIHITPTESEPMRVVESVRAVPGCGLEGDRYHRQPGAADAPTPDQEVTLIEMEALEALLRDYGVELSAAECRRNLATRGVALNHLVGREFSVGSVRMRGVELCEPCGHLEKLTGKKVIKGLVHRGGLRAQLLSAGTIAAGDPVCTD